MEAGESGSRQSSHLAVSSTDAQSDYRDHRPRITLERPYREVPAMATATLISPSTPYHPHHPPFSPAYAPQHSQGPQVPPMISPVESTRRISDEAERPHRQSLPSIQDIIGARPNGLPHSQSIPPPFPAPSHAPQPRAYADAGPPSAGPEKRLSPRELHPSPSTFPRPDPLPAFSDSRVTAAPRTGPPPLSILPGPHGHSHHSPPVKYERHDMVEHRHAPHEGHLTNGHGPYPPHASHPSGHQAPSPYSHPSAPLPPGQLPLSAYPISPRHAGPPLSSPYDSQRPPLGPDDGDFGRNRQKYDGSMGRQYEAWNYSEQLARIGSTARTILHFAETYDKVAQEEHGPPLPGRLPSDAEISEMMHNCEWLKGMLENVRAVVKQTIINDRVREGSRSRSSYAEDEDVAMYGSEGSKQGAYSITEVKKRRGRAAPPGRCHSCNRIDTPEWRRGPDGARTLCNACGLHYAKLERKRQSERNIRPKISDDR